MRTEGDRAERANERLVGEADARARLPTPCLMVDLDVLEANLAAAARIAGRAGVVVRPHTKGHKCVELARLQIAAGAAGLCCTTLAEAELMAAADAPSLLITSPVVTEAQIARVLALCGRVPEILLAVDDERMLMALDEAAGGTGRTIPVLVDVDVGQRRTGVPGVDALVALATAAERAPHLSFRGIQAYYGHLQAIADYDERAQRAGEAQAYIRECLDALGAQGLAAAIVSGAGTGTSQIDAGSGLFTELQLGSHAFLDATYLRETLTRDNTPLFAPALFVRGRVVSAQQPDRVTIDIGMKAMSTDQGPGLVVAPEGLEADYAVAGDEHGFLMLKSRTQRPGVGDAVELIPGHCDTTVNLHAAIHAMRGDRLEAIWPIGARGSW